MSLISRIQRYWNSNPCNSWFFPPSASSLPPEDLVLSDFTFNSSQRYFHEPEVLKFTDFSQYSGLDVLEVGYGLGSDAALIACQAKSYTGIDLSETSLRFTKARFAVSQLKGTLYVEDVKNTGLPSSSFDAIYSWGVIHHSGDIVGCLQQIYRLLRPGGTARIMIYNKDSLVVFTYWLLFCIKQLDFTKTRAEVISKHVESPGTLVLSTSEFKEMATSCGFSVCSTALYREFFYTLSGYPYLLRPLIRIYGKLVSLLLGGESRIGYFMCTVLAKPS